MSFLFIFLIFVIALSYQILPNIIFIISVLAVLLLVLRRLPEVRKIEEQENILPPIQEKLSSKGLPIVAISKARATLNLWGKKTWNFVLEAKDLRPSALAGYKIRKLFGAGKSRIETENPKTLPGSAPAQVQIKEEKDYLEIIQQDPKNLGNYDALGKYYIDQSNFEDAKDIYEYLSQHQPGNSDFHGRLAYSYYQLKFFEKSVEHYQKSIELDSTQPSRYYNLGLSLENAGKSMEAIKAFEQAITLEPKNSKFFVSLSNTFIKLGEKVKAKKALLFALKVDPENENIQTKLQQINILETPLVSVKKSDK